MSNIAIVGSRVISARLGGLIWDLVASMDPTEDTVVSGGAKGADSRGAMAAKFFGVPVRIFYPMWDKFGKGAGFIRNQQIVDASGEVIAVWDGKSRGTRDTIRRAMKAGKPLVIIL